mmetsp:Transcript_9777/g.59477  ORF Transcript_9777/g.59477 Transcript_9777/m.59477 type:complete len:136 (+) Transcript_9777:2715-3122(+)
MQVSIQLAHLAVVICTLTRHISRWRQLGLDEFLVEDKTLLFGSFFVGQSGVFLYRKRFPYFFPELIMKRVSYPPCELHKFGIHSGREFSDLLVFSVLSRLSALNTQSEFQVTTMHGAIAAEHFTQMRKDISTLQL